MGKFHTGQSAPSNFFLKFVERSLNRYIYFKYHKNNPRYQKWISRMR
jgi:hypothetical protein